MRALSSRQFAAACGALFAVLYLGTLFGTLDLPEGTDSDAAVQAAFTDDRANIIVGVYLLALAGLAFLPFLGWLRGWLRDAAADRLYADVAFAGGLVYVTMLFAAAAAWGVLALGTALDEIPEPVDATLARTLTNLGFTLLLVFGLLGAAVMIFAASLAMFRAGGGPRWLAWAGIVIAPLLLLGPFYVPQVLVPLWVVAAAFGLGHGGANRLY